jgi:hypothetical protein
MRVNVRVVHVPQIENLFLYHNTYKLFRDRGSFGLIYRKVCDIHKEVSLSERVKKECESPGEGRQIELLPPPPHSGERKGNEV